MLVAKNITKKFSGVTALNNVCLELHPGKVNAIIGENGAGKSTLMKILSGVHTQYEGEIIYNGKLLRFSGTKEAEEAGIAIIHQELNLVPWLTIAENIFLGREITNVLGLLDKKSMNEKAGMLLRKLNLSISPDTMVATLKVGQQQLVEIAKALYGNASVIIMDEPTSAISDREADNLFSITGQLRGEGRTIVYISHKLNELFAIADRFVVLRDGTTVESGDMNTVSREQLIQKMTGRNLFFEKTGRSCTDGEALMRLENISLKNPVLKARNILENISFTLHKGEILGIYGLMGAGRTELLETIFGLHPKKSSGEISIHHVVKRITSPSDAIKAGIALVPEDRKLQGLFLDQTVRNNISITILHKLQQWAGLLHLVKEKKIADDYISRLGVKTLSSGIAVKNLSGGNQQKVILAKWLATNPQILLLDEPTRGVDINAKAEIYALMKSLAAEGMGIVMASSELPEIMAVSDRVLVFCEGSLTASLSIESASETEILKYAIHKN